MQVRELQRIDDIAAADWNALQGTDCPFLRHEFLAALEHSGCVGGDSGWTPAHLALLDEGRLLAATPVYRKSHSWGEFVFDFGWARAHEQYGLPYYPKLLLAVPFSPVNAPRLLLAAGQPAAPLRERLVRELVARCAGAELSSAHALFLTGEELAAFTAQGWLARGDVQFHWHNRGYAGFEDYLATFRSEKRKQIRRERRRPGEDGIHFLTLHGPDIPPSQLRFAFDMHERNFHLHGHQPYLNYAFFQEIACTLGDALMVKLACQGDTPVAAAVFLASRAVLYGRYWGAVGEFHSLHFETCYHQGIEYCIERGIARFEPGTQGEHKIVRGFEPATTHSAHYVAEPRLRRAIATFLERERAAVADYSAGAASHVPFHRG
ncbi:MAG TPA: GNAT family N-acetyltransferase [Steroidobacteraceae bacterium]|nr:GNAT family N-acetyltransferase [Steroidobacteraceae bacterium]